MTLLFSIGATVVRIQVVKGGAAPSIVLNFAWGVGFGWILPTAMRAMGMVRG